MPQIFTQIFKRPEVEEHVIGYGKTHKPLMSETVPRWIKGELFHAGVSISLNEAHISRSSSSRKTRDIGTSVQDTLIM